MAFSLESLLIGYGENTLTRTSQKSSLWIQLAAQVSSRHSPGRAETTRPAPWAEIRVLAYGDHLSFVPVRPIKSMRGFLKGMDATFERERDRL